MAILPLWNTCGSWQRRTDPSLRLMQKRSWRLPNSVGSLRGWGNRTCFKQTYYYINLSLVLTLPGYNLRYTVNHHVRCQFFTDSAGGEYTGILIDLLTQEERFLTRVWLCVSVTSAQKLQIVMAMVLPLKPSEGFPISPTLRRQTVTGLQLAYNANSEYEGHRGPRPACGWGPEVRYMSRRCSSLWTSPFVSYLLRSSNIWLLWSGVSHLA